MKVFRSLLILIVLSLSFYCKVEAQFAGLCENSFPLNNKSGNCIWLTNLTADQIKDQYLNRTDFKPEKIIPINEKTTEGYRLYYRHMGKLGWQKYWIRITTIRTGNTVSYYEENNPELLMQPFRGFKPLIGNYGHTTADFKKIYKQYQHLACRMYRQIPDNKGNLSDEMTMLLQKYLDATIEENLIASDNKDIAISTEQSTPVKDNWDYWIQFLQELETRGFISLIEYSTCPID